MAEAALGLGASAVAFMGLTGQVLQGCHYICKFIDNVRDAQDDLHHYSTEITTFKSTVLGFQEVLRAIEPSAMIESSIQQALLALQSGSVAIEELKTPLRRYKHDGQRDWWKDIKVAQKRSQFAKCVGRLGEAKVNILLAQSRVNLILDAKQQTETNLLQQTLTFMSANANSTSLKITQVQDSMIDLRAITYEAKRELAVAKSMVNERLDKLDLGLGHIINAAVNNAVRDVLSNLPEKHKCRGFREELGHPTDGQHKWTTASSSFQDVGTSKRTPRPTQSHCLVSFWFVNITIDSNSTTVQELLPSCHDDAQLLHKTATTKTRVNIRLHPWIARKGVLAFIERQQFGSTSLNSDMRLRAYSVIPATAPIAFACWAGDFVTAHSLFQSGQASVFDEVSLLNESLFDWTWRSLITNIQNVNDGKTVDLKNLDCRLQILKFFIANGIDPGEPPQQNGQCQMSRLHELLENAIASPDFLIPYLMEIIRTIITKSRETPFEARSRYQGPLMKVSSEILPELGACIQSQERWCLYDCFEKDLSIPVKRSLWTCAGSLDFPFCAYSLVRDPDAIYLRAVLHYGVFRYDLYSVCRKSLKNSRFLAENIGGCWHHAVIARVNVCLELGMDFRTPMTLYAGGVTLVEYFSYWGCVQILKSAWLDVGKSLDSFSANFEGCLVSAVARHLDDLRPVRRWRQVADHDEFYLELELRVEFESARSVFSDEGYRKYFPDDEWEVGKLMQLTNFDEIHDYWSSQLRRLHRDMESGSEFDTRTSSETRSNACLPAINGITEEFWD